MTATAQVSNFKELMESRGMDGSTPYQWGRALYKYTDCGPWVTFLTVKNPARTVTLTAIVKELKNEVKLTMDQSDEDTKDFAQFLGFNLSGIYEDNIVMTMKKFRSLIRSYQRQDNIRMSDRKVTTRFKDGILTIKSIIDVPTTLGEIYYEDEEARTDNTDDIIGIKIGSIVEGSEVEIEPRVMMFPFDPEEVDKVLQEIGEEANFYWERDNSDWYFVNSPKGTLYVVKNTWGGIKWEGKPSNNEVVTMVESMIMDNPPIDDSILDIPVNKGWTLNLYINDGIF